MDKCHMTDLYTETRHIVTRAGITDICLEKLNPVLNAMTFAGDNESVNCAQE